MSVVNVRTFYPRLGKISCGYKAAKSDQGRTITYPVRSETLVFRSDDRERLDAVAAVLGGQVTPSPDPEAEGRWRVITTAKETEVIIPADDEKGWDAWYEFWGASGKLRQCDGARCLFAIDPQTGERVEDVPCVCAAQEFEGDQACKLTSRLNVFLPALMDVPGAGVWQVESRGRSTFMEIQGTLSLLARLGPISGVPLTLKVVIRESRDRDGAPRRFPTLTLSTKESFARLFQRARAIRGQILPGALPEPDRETAPLGAALSPEQEAAAREAEAVAPPPLAPIAAPNARGRPGRRGRGKRDYTAFWKAVGDAARIEGDATPQAWLERLAGQRDPREMDEGTFTGLAAVAQRVAAGQARTTQPGETVPATEPPAPAAPPVGAPPPPPPPSAADPITRDQIRSIQQAWRERGVHPNTQADQIRAASGGRSMILARLSAAEANQLLQMLTARPQAVGLPA
jgi:hypothetical protein